MKQSSIASSSRTDMPSITLRDVTPQDEPFLRAVYACTRAQELALVPWTAEQSEAFLRSQFDAQDKYYRHQYPAASFQLILEGTQPVGRLYVLREVGSISILDITVLPEHRNRGIGSRLIRGLIEEAEGNGQAVSIWVERFNPSLQVFQQYGFAEIADDGYNCHLERSPQKPREMTSS
jgi:ribosomal protein S18 acetylase RimI-like enzyme